MNTGKAAAYLQTNAPNSDLSGVVNQQERLNQEHSFIKEQKAERKKAENLQELDAISKVNPGQKTGYMSFDQAVADAYHREGGLVEQYADAVKRLKESGNTDNKAYGVKKAIEQYTANLGQMKQGMMAISQEKMKMKANGTYNDLMNKDFDANIDKIMKGGIYINTDDIQNISIDNLGKDIDLDGDGIPDKLSLQTFTDKNNFGYWGKKVSLDEINAGLTKKYETNTTIKVNPNGDNKYFEVTTQGLNPEHKLFVKDDYKSVFGETLDSLTPYGKDILLQNGINPKQIDNEKYDSFLNGLVNNYEKLRMKSMKEEMNFSAKTADSRNDREWSKYNDEKNNPNPEEEEKPKFKVQAVTNKPGELSQTRNFNGKDAVQFLGFKPFKTTNEDGEEVQIESLLLTEDGDISFKGKNLYVIKGKKDKGLKSAQKRELEKREDNFESDNDVLLNRIASNLGFADVNELYKEMEANKEFKINEKQPAKTNPTPPKKEVVLSDNSDVL